jgi:hypothetical protein
MTWHNTAAEIRDISLGEADAYAPALRYLPTWLPKGLKIDPTVRFIQVSEPDNWHVFQYNFKRGLRWRLEYAVVTSVFDYEQYLVMQLRKKEGFYLEHIQVSTHRGFLAIRGNTTNPHEQDYAGITWYARSHSLTLRTKNGYVSIAELLKIANSIAL